MEGSHQPHHDNDSILQDPKDAVPDHATAAPAGAPLAGAEGGNAAPVHEAAVAAAPADHIQPPPPQVVLEVQPTAEVQAGMPGAVPQVAMGGLMKPPQALQPPKEMPPLMNAQKLVDNLKAIPAVAQVQQHSAQVAELGHVHVVPKDHYAPDLSAMAEYENQELSLDLISKPAGGASGRKTRRGPMDEMRQLVRILVKIIPQSFPYLATTEDGGGNRISEDQIKYYLDKTLGDGPRPEWGLPRGWQHYLASLFGWATSQEFSAADAQQCAKRLPGRSWEAVEPVLDKFKLRPHTWKLPLQRTAEPNDGLYLLVEEGQARKRGLDGDEFQKPKKMRASQPNLSRAEGLPELEVWRLVQSLVKTAESKQGTTTNLQHRDALLACKRDVRDTVERCCLDLPQLGTPHHHHHHHLQAAGAMTGLPGLQPLQLQALHTQQPHVMHAQAQGQPHQILTYAEPVAAMPAPAVSAAMAPDAVHRPAVARPTAFTPVMRPGKPLGGRDKPAGSDHEATVSADDDEQDKGETVDQPQDSGDKEQQVPHQMGIVAQGTAADGHAPDEQAQAVQSYQAQQQQQQQGMQQQGMIYYAAPGQQVVFQQPQPQPQHSPQAPQQGQAVQGQVQQGTSFGFQAFPGMSYGANPMGMKAAGVNPMVPVQLPNGQIVYGQAPDMSQFQMQHQAQGQAQGQAAAAQMPTMMAPQPIVLTLQPHLGYQ